VRLIGANLTGAALADADLTGGNYYWDGSNWQPVGSAGGDEPSGSSEVGSALTEVGSALAEFFGPAAVTKALETMGHYDALPPFLDLIVMALSPAGDTPEQSTDTKWMEFCLSDHAGIAGVDSSTRCVM
jgi:hypothetical protein